MHAHFAKAQTGPGEAGPSADNGAQEGSRQTSEALAENFKKRPEASTVAIRAGRRRPHPETLAPPNRRMP
jgi:hypothetical protein